jgi:ribosomal protein S15P/S13E
MDKEKMMEHGRNLRTDIGFALLEDSEIIVEEKDEKVVQWLIEQAEKVESLTNGIREVRKYIDEHSGDVDNPRRLAMDEVYEVFMKLTRLL